MSISSWIFDVGPKEGIFMLKDFLEAHPVHLFTSLLTILCGLLVVIAFYIYVIKKDARVQRLVNNFPGPPTFPIFGNSHSLIRPNHKLLNLKDEWGKVYGFLFRVWIINLPFIVVGTASSAEKVLGSNVHINKSDEYQGLEPWLGTGLLTASGKKWFTRRKLLTPTFHFKILEDFFEVFNEQSQILVNILKKECCNGKVFNMYPYFTHCALDIICETAMGKRINAQTERDSISYVKAVYGMAHILVQRITQPWLRYEWIFQLSWQCRKQKEYLKILHGFTESVIKERKLEKSMNLTPLALTRKNSKITEAEQEDGSIFKKKKRQAFLDLLLDISEDGETLSDLDIREEVDTIMFEGHDTTAASLNWTLFLLATYPEHQRKVQQELDEIFGSDRSRDITMADTSKMKYLDCCIKESLRLYPSVPIIARKLTEDCPMDDGLIAPAGCVAAVVPFLLHVDPITFPDPESFKPDRFSPENSVGRHPYAFVPFSAGPRNCVGQKFAMFEEKVVLANVLRNFNLVAAEKREDVQVVPDVILRPMNGLHITLSER